MCRSRVEFIRICAICSVLLSIFNTLFAQAPDTLWTRTYGGVDEDRGHSVQQTSDGGYIIAGYTSTPATGSYDVYLIKTDTEGYILWEKIYGGHRDDIARSVQQTTDGGYVITGSTASFGNPAVWLLKTDANGDTLWTKTYGWSNSDNIGYSVQQTADGGYVIGGTTINHVLLIKTDANGDSLWIREYGIMGYSGGFSAMQTSEGGYIICGFYYSASSGYDLYLVKTDSSGDTLWTRVVGGPGYDRLYCVKETSDGGYIAVGGMNMQYGKQISPDVCLIKTNNSGDIMWLKTYGGPTLDDVGYSVLQTSNGQYVIAGRTYSIISGYFDTYLIKTDLSGDTLWTTSYEGYCNDWGNSVQATTDGGYVIAGMVGSSSGTWDDVYLIKTAPDTFGIEENEIKNRLLINLKIFPNPFSDRINIKFQVSDNSKLDLKIYDATGRVIKQFSYLSNHPFCQISWDGRDNTGRKLPSGVYFLKFEREKYNATEKLILLK